MANYPRMHGPEHFMFLVEDCPVLDLLSVSPPLSMSNNSK